MKKNPLLVALGILLTVSCNSDSTELPPSKYEFDTPYFQTVSLNGRNALKLAVIERANLWTKSSVIVLENISGTFITDLGVYIESCNSEVNYDKCNDITFVPLVKGDTLKNGDQRVVDLGYRLPDVNDILRRIIVTSYLPTNNASIIYGKYYHKSELKYFDSAGKELSSGFAKCFIDVDGEVYFHFVQLDGAGTRRYQNLSGKVNRENQIIGRIQFEEAPTVDHSILTERLSSNVWIFKMAPIVNGIAKVELTLL